MTTTGNDPQEIGLEAQELVDLVPGSNLDSEAATELEYLRTILWGQRKRQTTQQVKKVEAGLNQNSRDMLTRMDAKLRDSSESHAAALHKMQAELAEQLAENATHSSNALRTTRQDLNDRLDGLGDRLDADTHDTRNELTKYIDQRIDQQSALLRRTQDELTARIDTLAEDLFNQLSQSQRALSSQIAAQTAELDDRIKMARADSMQDTINVRDDIEARLQVIDKKLASRNDLSKLYMELSRRLHDDVDHQM